MFGDGRTSTAGRNAGVAAGGFGTGQWKGNKKGSRRHRRNRKSAKSKAIVEPRIGSDGRKRWRTKADSRSTLFLKETDSQLAFKEQVADMENA